MEDGIRVNILSAPPFCLSVVQTLDEPRLLIVLVGKQASIERDRFDLDTLRLSANAQQRFE